MRPSFIWPFLFVAVIGCANRLPGGTDPFFGRTTVAPPGTGSAAAGDPAYSNRGLASIPNPPNAAASSSPAASAWFPAVAKAPEPENPPAAVPSAPVPIYNSSVPLNIASSASAPVSPINTVNPLSPATVTGNTTYTPAGGMAFSNNSSGRSLTSSSGPGPKMTRTRVSPMSLSESPRQPAASSPATADNRTRTFGQLGQVSIDSNGTANTLSSPASGGGSWTAPNRIDLPGRVIDIMDLPPKGSGGSAGVGTGFARPGYSSGVSTAVHQDADVRQATFTAEEPPGGGQAANPYPEHMPESNKPVTFDPQPKYGHGEDYSWLKGRLEYSQAGRSWKLRYIPIDGAADRFGGSVVLRDTSLLSGCERGDYVEVKGRLADGNGTAGDFAPDYEITQIKRQ